MTCVAIIPARGGSRGIPRKNLVPVAGKPLLAYTIADDKGGFHAIDQAAENDVTAICEAADLGRFRDLRRDECGARQVRPGPRNHDGDGNQREYERQRDKQTPVPVEGSERERQRIRRLERTGERLWSRRRRRESLGRRSRGSAGSAH